jgi:hypothetical protein
MYHFDRNINELLSIGQLEANVQKYLNKLVSGFSIIRQIKLALEFALDSIFLPELAEVVFGARKRDL